MFTMPKGSKYTEAISEHWKSLEWTNALPRSSGSIVPSPSWKFMTDSNGAVTRCIPWDAAFVALSGCAEFQCSTNARIRWIAMHDGMQACPELEYCANLEGFVENQCSKSLISKSSAYFKGLYVIDKLDLRSNCLLHCIIHSSDRFVNCLRYPV